MKPLNNDIIRINYRKKDGSETQRQVIHCGAPRESYLALEAKEGSEANIAEMRQFLIKQKAELDKKMAELGFAYKTFLPEGLEILEIEQH